ncbi:MAG: hypothetical protein MI748_02505 [Opitutales bacterium]|nr:hypothetical protein [Opitutales bacterium]
MITPIYSVIVGICLLSLPLLVDGVSATPGSSAKRHPGTVVFKRADLHANQFLKSITSRNTEPKLILSKYKNKE